MDEFIFGPLPPVEERMRRIVAARAGVTHRQARQPFDPRPDQPVRLELMVGPGFHCDRAWVYWTDDGSRPAGHLGRVHHGFVQTMELSGAEWDTSLWGYILRFQAELPGQPAGSVVRYQIGAAAPDDSEYLADNGKTYAYYVDQDPPPLWTKQAVVYQIFVDRFFPGSEREWLHPADLMGIFGGSIRGITEKLDYMENLGVNVLWLSPIFPSPTHHGYDASDYLEVEPRLGSKTDLRELLEKAHQREMRVLLDLVPNHFSNHHPIFLQAQNDPNSPYRDWFTFTHWPDQYATFFNNPGMPKVNLNYPPARQYLLDAAVYWLELGVDGFRIDHAIGPAPDFWADFRRATRAARPDSWTFGEVTDPPDEQIRYAGGMDGCLDFLLTEMLRRTFAFQQVSAAGLASFLERHNAFFPDDFSRPSFLDNHDMNRFLWAANGDKRRLRLAAMCQFTLPGQPVIYHGTEVGLSQVCDVHEPGHGLEESRLPHPWDSEQDLDLYAYYRELTSLRRKHPFFSNRQLIVIQSDEETLVYQRPAEDNRTRGVYVALNLSEQARTLTLPFQTGPALLTSDSNSTVQSHAGTTTLMLEPMGGIILQD